MRRAIVRRPLLIGVLLALSAVLPAGWLAGSVGAAFAGLAVVILTLVWTPPAAGRVTSRRAPSHRDDGSEAIAWLPDPVILIDQRGVVTSLNAPALAAVPGLRDRHPLAFGLRDPGVLAAVRSALASGEAHVIEFGGRVPTETTFEARILPIASAGRVERGPVLALVLRDLGERRRLEAMRVDFVANVSHELRTPLSSVIGFIETLQGPARDDEAARTRFLGIMSAQAQRMKRLIDDLLQLSRVELKEHVAPSNPVDLGHIARHMLDIMRPAAARRGVDLVAAIPSEALAVAGDRDELLRLVENLVENAVRYGGAGGSVKVEIAREAGRVVLRVIDNGPGIAPEHLPRLTERFYRVDPVGSRDTGGTGLGLAIVKHIVARHRGRLTIDSKPGAGSTFTVTLAETVMEVSSSRHTE